MSSSNPRLNFHVPPAVFSMMEEAAKNRCTTKSAVVLRALGIMQAVDAAAKSGRRVVITSEHREDDIPLNAISPFV